MSLGWTDYNLILGKKLHQLEALNRNKFRVKGGAILWKTSRRRQLGRTGRSLRSFDSC